MKKTKNLIEKSDKTTKKVVGFTVEEENDFINYFKTPLIGYF